MLASRCSCAARLSSCTASCTSWLTLCWLTPSWAATSDWLMPALPSSASPVRALLSVLQARTQPAVSCARGLQAQQCIATQGCAHGAEGGRWQHTRLTAALGDSMSLLCHAHPLPLRRLLGRATSFPPEAAAALPGPAPAPAACCRAAGDDAACPGRPMRSRRAAAALGCRLLSSASAAAFHSAACASASSACWEAAPAAARELADTARSEVSGWSWSSVNRSRAEPAATCVCRGGGGQHASVPAQHAGPSIWWRVHARRQPRQIRALAQHSRVQYALSQPAKL